MSYDNTNRGVLFKNDQKGSDSQPDYKGRINVGGKESWLSAWIKTAKDGRKFMSLSVTAMEAEAPKTRQVRPDTGKQPGGFDEMDDNLPF